ncbi:MAG: pro-sigmaK processing inhibitor BofA family protein [Clostridia bacterium]
MGILSSVIAFAVGLFLIWVIFKIFGFTLKVFWKLLINALIGAVILIVVNLIGGFFNFTLDITPLNALITGVFGVPGAIVLIILKLI